jgi:hypothetical protein
MGQERKDCKCNTPTPWEDAKGRKTNMCKECGGLIPEAKPHWRDKGSTFIKMEAAVAKLELPPEEQDMLWAMLNRKVEAWVKHTYQAGCLNASTEN